MQLFRLHKCIGGEFFSSISEETCHLKDMQILISIVTFVYLLPICLQYVVNLYFYILSTNQNQNWFCFTWRFEVCEFRYVTALCLIHSSGKKFSVFIIRLRFWTLLSFMHCWWRIREEKARMIWKFSVSYMVVHIKRRRKTEKNRHMRTLTHNLTESCWCIPAWHLWSGSLC